MGEFIRVKKSPALKGTVKIDGAKNAALPLLAASLLATEEVILEDLPKLKDIENMIEVLKHLGSEVEYLSENTLRIDSSKLDKYETPYTLMERMRASFLVMGPLLAKLGQTKTSLPGGCAIGARPVDLHLKGFKALGAEIYEGLDRIESKAPEGGLKGNRIYLDFPSVGATQNIMMAASLAKGETVIENAAKEPEIVDLANFLNKMGAKIRGAGTGAISIVGVDKLKGARHKIIPDRIEAATFLVAAAMTKGHVIVENVIASHIMPVIAKLREMGNTVIENESEDKIEVIGTENPLSTNIRTLPYPGFPTDAQAQFMTYMTICKGVSKVEENVFENRFMHVKELEKMGALISTQGSQVASIRGVPSLKGAKLKATDLRAGAALVIAGLVAEGESEIHNIYHIYRGYNNFVEKLRNLGAIIEKVGE